VLILLQFFYNFILSCFLIYIEHKLYLQVTLSFEVTFIMRHV